MNASNKLRFGLGRLGNIFFRLSIFCLVASLLCLGSSVAAFVLAIVYFCVVIVLMFVTLFTIFVWGPDLFGWVSSEVTEEVAVAVLNAGAALGVLCVIFSVLSAILLRLDVPINRARDNEKFVAMVVIGIIGLVLTIISFVTMAGQTV